MDAKIPFTRGRLLTGRLLTGHLLARRRLFGRLRRSLWPLALTAIAGAHAAASPLSIKAIAEIESTTTQGGRTTAKLMPADRVVPGDRLIYTLEVRNISTKAVAAPIVTNPVPDHMQYVADSAVGTGAQVSYSVDGGRSFDTAQNLKVRGVDGRLRPAVAADYTHIRWRLKNSLKVNSVAFVRFRALVK